MQSEHGHVSIVASLHWRLHSTLSSAVGGWPLCARSAEPECSASPSLGSDSGVRGEEPLTAALSCRALCWTTRREQWSDGTAQQEGRSNERQDHDGQRQERGANTAKERTSRRAIETVGMRSHSSAVRLLTSALQEQREQPMYQPISYELCAEQVWLLRTRSSVSIFSLRWHDGHSLWRRARSQRPFLSPASAPVTRASLLVPAV